MGEFEGWVDEFRSRGFPETTLIGAGMEGAVYSLVPHELVAKVWQRADRRHLELLKEFYEALHSPSSRLATPQVRKIECVHGKVVTFENFLPGQPLQTYLSGEASKAKPAAVEALIDVLKFLRSVRVHPVFRRIPVLNETRSPWRGSSTWSNVVRTTLSARLNRFRAPLQRSIPDLDSIVKAVLAFLGSREGTELGLVHGDLCGTNIMVDASLQPVALFDFGFLSTVGDPAFDASVAAGVYDMYGPHSSSIDREISERLARELGYSVQVLLSYRAVYSLLTSTAYSERGNDGHFDWCMSMLRRDDVRGALKL